MDQSHPPLMANATPVLDHEILVAGAAVRQAATHTAALAERLRLPQVPGDTPSALVAIFSREDPHSAALLSGSFHPRVARRATGKAPANLMKTGFTLAF